LISCVGEALQKKEQPVETSRIIQIFILFSLVWIAPNFFRNEGEVLKKWKTQTFSSSCIIKIP